jgi:hypothetical protein
MQEVIQAIVDRVQFENKEKVQSFLNTCIKVSKDSNISTYAVHDNVHFKTYDFFKGLNKLTNDITKDKRLAISVDTLSVALEELGIELDPGEVFIVYHLRDQGKFRMKESKLKEQLKGMWGQNKEYALDDGEFSYALKSLMRKGIIEYRKGNLSLKPGFIISYKTKK